MKIDPSMIEIRLMHFQAIKLMEPSFIKKVIYFFDGCPAYSNYSIDIEQIM